MLLGNIADRKVLADGFVASFDSWLADCVAAAPFPAVVPSPSSDWLSGSVCAVAGKLAEFGAKRAFWPQAPAQEPLLDALESALADYGR